MCREGIEGRKGSAVVVAKRVRRNRRQMLVETLYSHALLGINGTDACAGNGMWPVKEAEICRRSGPLVHFRCRFCPRDCWDKGPRNGRHTRRCGLGQLLRSDPNSVPQRSYPHLERNPFHFRFSLILNTHSDNFSAQPRPPRGIDAWEGG